MAKKNSTSRQRIAEMMSVLNIKQVDIVKKTGIPKSSLSNYLNGKRTPNQEQLSVIADPYGINPAWLMGYNVPMWLKDAPIVYENPEEFERAWQELGGTPHPTYTAPWTDKGAQYDLILTKEEYDFIIEVRKRQDESFYKRMKAYMDLLIGDKDNANR